MTKEECKELETAVFEFVKRVASGQASATETEVLPFMTEKLLEIHDINEDLPYGKPMVIKEGIPWQRLTSETAE